jgi:hypothetical protein
MGTAGQISGGLGNMSLSGMLGGMGGLGGLNISGASNSGSLGGGFSQGLGFKNDW